MQTCSLLAVFNKKLSALCLVAVSLVLFSCRQQTSVDLVTIPAHFPAPVYTFKNNPLSEAGVNLGKLLFKDPILSSDSSIACISCHKQQFAFADGGQALSEGVHGQKGRRNAPAIFNVLWSPYFMWDGGVNHIEVMPLAPITDTLEMAESLNRIIEKLQRSKLYPPLFKETFGTDSIYTRNIMLALAQYMGTLISSQSLYDEVREGQKKFTAPQEQGYRIFQQKCITCHAGELLTDYSFRNNGLDSTFEKDRGRARVTDQAMDEGKFKVPSLRNVALTAPYMHDGRFASLADVINHYSNGVKYSATLDAELKNGEQPGITLTETEKKSLLAFLLTLTDVQFVKNKKLAP